MFTPPPATDAEGTTGVGDALSVWEDDAEVVDGPEPGEFEAPCQSNLDCNSGYCVQTAAGDLCTQACSETCPTGYECKAVTLADTSTVFLCVPPSQLLCSPCVTDAQCQGGTCVILDGEGRCTLPCGDDQGCPDFYTCAPAPNGESEGSLCQPLTGSCSCNAYTNGGVRSCVRQNEDGACYGNQVCKNGAGWTPCSAPEPGQEICDGVDNDCDGLLDDGIVDGEPCTNDLEGVGSCPGVTVCAGLGGMLCQGPEPTLEVCNGQDDDCDELIDEDFLGEGGAWTLNNHCGYCHNACADKIVNGTGVCGGSEETPICVVETCDEGYVQVGDYQCVPPVDLSCAPCSADADCLGGSCVALDGQSVCASPCDVDGGCAPGFVCADIGGEALRCVPLSGTCSCTESNAGASRPCQQSTEAGVCIGFETCDPALGWGGCTALLPSFETCDGLDNDCDGVVDDGVGAGEPCDIAVEGVGTCSGVQVCLGPGGLICQGPEPTLEGCNGLDDDCDGEVDEDFTDPAGLWTLDAHCGQCNQDCATKIDHGTGKCAGDPLAPVCVVDTCDEGYLELGDYQCVPPVDLSCVPCSGDADCLGGSCVDVEGQMVCLSPCGLDGETCAEGFSCSDVQGEARCAPVNGSCTCGPANSGGTRPCQVANDAGVCLGYETCDEATGWGGCTASTPAEEICDGLDNDCDGVVDDAVAPPDAPCASSNASGTCVGTWYCVATDGATDWWCSAPDPAEELCDFVDNDCDGVVDGPYRVGDEGPYVHDEHCGACGVSCVGQIPNASAHCTLSADGDPRCEVLACDPGTYQAGPLTCLPVSDDLCAPCETDDQCPTPGDRCVPLAEGGACGRDCGEGSLHGEPGVCPEGFTCTTLEGQGSQCIPTSGACSCLPANAGEARPCVITNQEGTCFGQESCDPEQGWVGCSAKEPTLELCDGLDNDCNASVDDVVGRGEPCESSNQHGTCTGVMDCKGSSAALVCSASTPAAEVCNGVDDDCDGEVDNEVPAAPCELQLGVCAGSTQLCAGSVGLLACDLGSYGPNYQVTETACDGLDNDCDGITDGIDLDQDGHIDAACGGDDCDDLNPLVHAGAVELCGDGLDNDCNGVPDDRDDDNDGHIDAQCTGYEGPLPVDDCNDNAKEAHPGLDEVCGDGLDNDCDGSVDNVDLDGDKYLAASCGGPDCVDSDPDVHPGALEVCDGKDNECNGVIDDKDADKDGHIDAQCVAYAGLLPIDDCDDGNLGVNPDMDEVCGNAFDEDCSGALDDKDVDKDGAVDTDPLCGGDDCDDHDPMVYPSAPEVRDGKDNNCDPLGQADEGLLSAGALIVTEVLYDSSATPDENFEWFELFNPSDRPINMRTWMIHDQPGSSQEVAVVSEDLIVPPRGFAVACRTGSAEFNGGVACDYEYGFMQLGNTSDELILTVDEVVIDTLSYDENAGWPKATSGSMSLDPDALGADNDQAALWCNHPNGPEIGNGDEGTPGVGNVSCSVDVSAPQLSAIHPSDGVAEGGTLLTIAGAGLLGLTDLQIDGVSCTLWSVESDHLATCLSPAGLAGDVEVTAIEGDATDTLSAGFRYTTSAVGGVAEATLMGPEEQAFLRDTWSQAIRARVSVPGLTGGGCPLSREYEPMDLIVQVGFGPPDTDPASTGAWRWSPGYCDEAAADADIFKGVITTDTPGLYAAAARVSVDGGQSWHYADLNGAGGPFDPEQLSTLSVQ